MVNCHDHHLPPSPSNEAKTETLTASCYLRHVPHKIPKKPTVLPHVPTRDAKAEAHHRLSAEDATADSMQQLSKEPRTHYSIAGPDRTACSICVFVMRVGRPAEAETDTFPSTCSFSHHLPRYIFNIIGVEERISLTLASPPARRLCECGLSERCVSRGCWEGWMGWTDGAWMRVRYHCRLRLLAVGCKLVSDCTLFSLASGLVNMRWSMMR